MTAAGVLSFVAAKDYETPDDADTDGVYEVTVQVSDGGRTDSADLTVTVTNVNEAPTADAGADQENATQGDTVTLNGSGTDPDSDSGDTLSYAWTQSGTPAVTLSDSAVGVPGVHGAGGAVGRHGPDVHLARDGRRGPVRRGLGDGEDQRSVASHPADGQHPRRARGP